MFHKSSIARSTSPVISGLICGLAWIFLTCMALPASVVSSFVWQFDEDQNPMSLPVPGSAEKTALCAITIGYGSEGWLQGLDSLGKQRGIWDMGGKNPEDPASVSQGSVEIRIPNIIDFSGSDFTDVKVKVVQFVDGFLFSGEVKLTLQDSICVETNMIEAVPVVSPNAGWKEFVYQCRLTPAPNELIFKIIGGESGMLIDKVGVIFENGKNPAITPVISSVSKSSSFVKLAWVGGRPPFQIYKTNKLNENVLWQPVGNLVEGYEVEVPLDGAEGYYKIGCSN